MTSVYACIEPRLRQSLFTSSVAGHIDLYKTVKYKFKKYFYPTQHISSMSLTSTRTSQPYLDLSAQNTSLQAYNFVPSALSIRYPSIVASFCYFVLQFELLVNLVFFLCIFLFGGVRLSPLRTPATMGLFYHDDDDDDKCGTVTGVRIGKGSVNTRRKLTSVPHCPTQIPEDLTWDHTRATEVESRRMTV
jgi:hypothetical protein